MTTNVIRLIDRAPGFSPGDQKELLDWLAQWSQALGDGDYGNFRSISVILERDDGRLAVINQAIVPVDQARAVGLLMAAAHRMMDGATAISDLRIDS